MYEVWEGADEEGPWVRGWLDDEEISDWPTRPVEPTSKLTHMGWAAIYTWSAK